MKDSNWSLAVAARRRRNALAGLLRRVARWADRAAEALSAQAPPAEPARLEAAPVEYVVRVDDERRFAADPPIWTASESPSRQQPATPVPPPEHWLRLRADDPEASVPPAHWLALKPQATPPEAFRALMPSAVAAPPTEPKTSQVTEQSIVETVLARISALLPRKRRAEVRTAEVRTAEVRTAEVRADERPAIVLDREAPSAAPAVVPPQAPPALLPVNAPVPSVSAPVPPAARARHVVEPTQASLHTPKLLGAGRSAWAGERWPELPDDSGLWTPMEVKVDDERLARLAREQAGG